MQFALKTKDGPVLVNTINWIAVGKSGSYYLMIDDVPFELSKPAFDLIYTIQNYIRPSSMMSYDFDTMNVEIWL